MLILLIFGTLVENVLCSCPSGFELVRDGECRGKYITSTPFYYDEAAQGVISQCQAIQAEPITIHNEEHQSYWVSHNWYRVMGLVCNNNTKQWEWYDGSTIDYKPPSGNYDKELDQECVTGCYWWVHNDGHWYHKCGHTSVNIDVCCVVTLQPSAKSCDNFDDDGEDSVCYQIGATAENWHDAQMICRNFGADLASIHNQQENAFIRRLAVSKGTVNGVYLGGILSGKGSGFGWIDGSEWDYENFYPGFPIDGLGECLSMDTFGVTGQWMNMDCSSTLAVACVRQPNTSYTDACSQGPWSEGQLIYSPGYPYDASIPCDYFLTVDAGKRVEVKVQLLEANTCCDHLVLNDNYLAGNIVANLTGEISAKTYTTKSSNLMRVSWQPNGGVNVRGFMMTYRAV